MNKQKRIILIGILFLMLIGVRILAQFYFYDPLIIYFKNDYLYMGIPEMEVMKFWGFLTVRYLLNTGLSLLIIYLAFYNIKILRFSVKFYALAFVVFGMLFWVLLNLDLNLGYRLTFYVRRFLIHPLFLLILLPAFYYQKLKRNKAN